MKAIWGRKDADFDALYLLSLRPSFGAVAGDVQVYVQALEAVLKAGGDLTVPDLIEGGLVLRDDEVSQVVSDWNGLPADKQARCHIPRHGLATVQDGRVDWFASICFECANVYLAGPSVTERHRIIQNRGCPFDSQLTALLEK